MGGRREAGRKRGKNEWIASCGGGEGKGNGGDGRKGRDVCSARVLGWTGI